MNHSYNTKMWDPKTIANVLHKTTTNMVYDTDT